MILEYFDNDDGEASKFSGVSALFTLSLCTEAVPGHCCICKNNAPGDAYRIPKYGILSEGYRPNISENASCGIGNLLRIPSGKIER